METSTGQLLIPTAFETSSWPMLLKQVVGQCFKNKWVANAFNTSGAYHELPKWGAAGPIWGGAAGGTPIICSASVKSIGLR